MGQQLQNIEPKAQKSETKRKKLSEISVQPLQICRLLNIALI